jgi:hypothetical protein
MTPPDQLQNPSDHHAPSISLQRYARTSRPRVRATSPWSVARMALRPHHQWCHAVVSRPTAVVTAVASRTGAASRWATMGPTPSPTPVHNHAKLRRDAATTSSIVPPCDPEGSGQAAIRTPASASAQVGRRRRVANTGVFPRSSTGTVPTSGHSAECTWCVAPCTLTS